MHSSDGQSTFLGVRSVSWSPASFPNRGLALPGPTLVTRCAPARAFLLACLSSAQINQRQSGMSGAATQSRYLLLTLSSSIATAGTFYPAVVSFFQKGGWVKTATQLLVLAVIVLGMAELAGCNFGQKARDEAQLPVLRDASVGVIEDARVGILALPAEEHTTANAQVAAFLAAFSSIPMDPDTVPLWGPVAALCELGIVARIESGAIGPNVAESLRERVRLFEESLRMYLGGTP